VCGYQSHDQFVRVGSGLGRKVGNFHHEVAKVIVNDH